MQELANELQKAADMLGGEGTRTMQPWTCLDRAAGRWAQHALSTYRGETLVKALEISRAIVEFTAELEPFTPPA